MVNRRGREKTKWLRSITEMGEVPEAEKHLLLQTNAESMSKLHANFTMSKEKKTRNRVQMNWKKYRKVRKRTAVNRGELENLEHKLGNIRGKRTEPT